MSYKNPRIIDDKSGLIVSQAMEKASGTLAQGVVAFGAEEKRREEVLEQENKRRDAVFMGLANEMAENSALFDAGLEKGSSELRGVLIPRNEELLKEINSIDIQQQINGNKDPRLSKRRSDLVRQISNGNTFAKSYIETASNLTEIMKDPQAFQIGQKTYVERDGSKDESEAILLATGGDPNFVTSFGNDLSITVTNKKTGKSFKNSRQEFESKSKNLYITKNHNTAVQETELMRGSIYNEDGSVNYLLLKGMGPKFPDSSTKDRPGYVTNYDVQPLNGIAVENIKKESIDKTLAAIDSYTSKQKQALYLKDIGITGKKLEEYQNGDKSKRRELIKGSSDLIFEKNSGITKDDNGNYVIKTQVGNPIKITYTKPDKYVEERRKTLAPIYRNIEEISSDDLWIAKGNSKEAITDRIINSLAIDPTAGMKLTATEDGNLSFAKQVLDEDAMNAVAMDLIDETTGAKTRNPEYGKEIYKNVGFVINITDENPMVNRNNLYAWLKEQYSLSTEQAEELAIAFLNK